MYAVGTANLQGVQGKPRYKANIQDWEGRFFTAPFFAKSSAAYLSECRWRHPFPPQKNVAGLYMKMSHAFKRSLISLFSLLFQKNVKSNKYVFYVLVGEIKVKCRKIMNMPLVKVHKKSFHNCARYTRGNEEMTGKIFVALRDSSACNKIKSNRKRILGTFEWKDRLAKIMQVYKLHYCEINLGQRKGVKTGQLMESWEANG